MQIKDSCPISGHGIWELFAPGAFERDGAVVGYMLDRGEFDNVVTQLGDQYWGERAASPVGVTPPAQITGMQLGTGATAAAKTGAGAAIVAYITGSAIGLASGYPKSDLVGGLRAMSFRVIWLATVATNSGIAEVSLINQSLATDAGAPAANTIARTRISPAINKPADGVLQITWAPTLGAL